MINTVLFTKNRPLQCRAFLESFRYATGYDLSKVNVICNDPENYTDLKEEFKYQEIDDKILGFNTTVRNIVNNLQDDSYITFAVDDWLYTEFINLDAAKWILDKNAQIDCVSLRLGNNLNEPVSIAHYDPRFVVIDSKKSSGNFNYWWELSGTLYRSKYVKDTLNKLKQGFLIPNQWETAGMEYYFKDPKEYNMAVFNRPNAMVCLELNMVQALYKNKVQGTENQTAEKLLEDYKNDKRLRWENYWGLKTDKLFLNDCNLWQLYTK